MPSGIGARSGKNWANRSRLPPPICRNMAARSNCLTRLLPNWWNGSRVVQELAGMSEASFVGHSLGAGLARFYASAHSKRVSHLVLADGGTVPRLPGFVKRIMRSPVFAPFADAAGQQTFSVQTIRSAFVNQTLVTPELIKESQDASHGFTSMVRRVVEGELPVRQNPKVPTILIWGDHDRIAPKDRAQEIAAEFDVAELGADQKHGTPAANRRPAVVRENRPGVLSGYTERDACRFGRCARY